MGDLNFINNLGEAIFKNGIIYERVSSTPGGSGVADTVDSADLIARYEYTWDHADDNGHTVYSAARMLAGEVFHSNASYLVNGKSWSTPWFENFPITGILRMWGDFSFTGATQQQVFVNGIYRGSCPGSGFSNAIGVAVVAGDTVEFYNNELYTTREFFSRTYPYTYDGND